MNRIIEDRLLLDECERSVLVLRDVLKGTGLKLGIKAADDLLDKIKKHREKFTRRILDKEAYIRKNRGLFDAIHKRDSCRVAGSYFDLPKDLVVDTCEKTIYKDLVGNRFYSGRTARTDVIRSLMKTYRKIFDK